ncbi:unnamed protein product [Caenorhabditis angaria]|uniref:BTB domain-containing protein n=1 Tax=Caenorhabditis angaria TaxID=860376 RepID=A0A9P1I8N6_9PELO|nr:unnamed protein product [Caenorhabditis angaria]
MNPDVHNGNKLRLKFENIKNLTEEFVRSDKLTIGNVDWILKIRTEVSNKVKYLSAYLEFGSENVAAKNWICEIKIDIKLLGGIGPPRRLGFEQCYHADTHLIWGNKLVKWSDLLTSGCIKNDSISIDVNFNFRLFDFSKKIDNETDMIVVVEGTEFHLNKWALGSRSEYFRELIMKTKPNDLKQCKIEGITSKLFCYMLASFYPFSHTNLERHFEDLMKAAKQFGVPSLHKKCEEFLMSKKCALEIVQKIKLAEENGYEELMEKCIDSLETAGDVKNLHDDRGFMDLKDSTKVRIMDPLTKEERFSDVFSIGETEWKIAVFKLNNLYLAIRLYYDSQNKNEKNWICETETTFKLLKQVGEGENIERTNSDTYHASKFTWGYPKFALYYDLQNNKYKLNDSIVVEIDLSFLYYDFSKEIKNYTDIIVNVENTDFYLNKGVLCSKSEYFYHNIVDGKYTESIIKFDNLTAKDLCYILIPFNPVFNTVRDETYENLIEIAKIFDVPSLHQSVEQYLITKNKTLKTIEKIKLAEENGYEMLMRKCIESLKSGMEIKNLQVDPRFSELEEATKLRVMRRCLDFF